MLGPELRFAVDGWLEVDHVVRTARILGLVPLGPLVRPVQVLMRDAPVTLRRGSWITTCRCCLANSCSITRATRLSSIPERLSSLLSSLLRRRGMGMARMRRKY